MRKPDDKTLNDLYDKLTNSPAKDLQHPMIGYKNADANADADADADADGFDYIVTKGVPVDGKRIIQFNDYKDFSKSWVYESSVGATWSLVP
jgi:hypothetical protein